MTSAQGHGNAIEEDQHKQLDPQSQMSPDTQTKSTNANVPDFDTEDNNPFGHTLLSAALNGDKDKESTNSTSQKDANDESVLLYKDNKPSQSTLQSTMGFESRVKRLLRPDSAAEIHITEANNSLEGMLSSLKKYIVYTIKLVSTTNPKEEVQTRRRYSDFESLRDILTKIFPLIIIPPIPPKNYINLLMINNIVSKSANGSSKQLESKYSYINLTHLNSNKLIEHRKRLLANFLNNCLKIKQIRNLEFFSKFIDPNTNWPDEVALILSQLPKDIYRLNPENSLKTDPIYASLPHPSGNINISSIGFLSIPSKKKKPEPEEDSDEFSPKELNETSTDTHIDTSHLDSINKKIMENFIGLANDYTELGTVFNSFSLLLADAPIIRTKAKEDEGKLNLILDKMGQVFDRSYITMNALISELETRFSEPLGEEVQYSTSLRFVEKYQRRKIKQKKLLDAELEDKRLTLQGLEKAEEESSNTERAIQNDQVSRNNDYQLNRPNGNKFKFPNMGSIKKITQYVSDIMDQNPEGTRKQRIVDLKSKIATFEKCQGIMLADISYIADELNKNFKNFHKKQLKVIYNILLSYNGFLVNWAKKNLDTWEEIREEIVKL